MFWNVYSCALISIFMWQIKQLSEMLLGLWTKSRQTQNFEKPSQKRGFLSRWLLKTSKAKKNKLVGTVPYVTCQLTDSLFCFFSCEVINLKLFLFFLNSLFFSTFTNGISFWFITYSLDGNLVHKTWENEEMSTNPPMPQNLELFIFCIYKQNCKILSAADCTFTANFF